MSTESLVTVDDLSKSFTDSSGNILSIIEGISFTIPKRKIVTFLGASGCGKTTLLKIIAGLDLPSRGTIQTLIKAPGPKIGFLQQGERLLPWRSVLENVSLGLELTGSDKKSARRAALTMLERVEMLTFKDYFPSQLSGGMTQRVLVARTLITNPSLLLLDEPLGQLDVIGRKEIATIIKRYINDHDASALLVTHSVEEAVFISDLIFTLKRRPSQITNRFNLDGEQYPSLKKIERKDSFDIVLHALLGTLQEGTRP